MANGGGMRVGQWLRSSSGFATVGVALALVAGSVLALAGVGTSRSRINFGTGFAFLGSDGTDATGAQLALVNGADGQPATKFNVPDSKGKKVHVTQRDGHAYVVVGDDDQERVLYRLDDASLTTAAQDKLQPRQRVVRGGSSAWVVDESSGLVQQIDPDSLAKKGDPLKFSGRISVAADDDGHLVVAELDTAKVSIVEGGSAGPPTSVGSPGDDLTVVEAGGKPVVVNKSSKEVTLVKGGSLAKRVALPPGSGELDIPAESEGDHLVVLRRNGDRGELVSVGLKDGETKVTPVDTPIGSVGTPLVSGNAVYLVDRSAGHVITVDPETGKATADADAELGHNRDFETFVKDGFLWVNDPTQQSAVVVDRHGRASKIDKYKKDVPEINPEPKQDQPPDSTPPPPGQDTPLPPAPAPVPLVVPSVGPATPPPPVANAPGAPKNFKGLVGNNQVDLSWDQASSGGSPITKYTVRCIPDCGTNGPQIDLGVQGSTTVLGLKNGTSYDFELFATNSIGDGPSVNATGLTPTDKAPSAPTNVKATANPDGTATVTWDQPGDSGLTTDGYAIVATSNSASLPATASKTKSYPDVPATAGTSFTTKVDDLAYDDDEIGDWSFTVQAKSTFKGSAVASAVSAASAPIDVYKAPSFGATDVVAVTRSAAKTLKVTWPTPAKNGQNVQYTVSLCTGSCSASSSYTPQSVSPSVSTDGKTATATLGSLADGTAYTALVVATNTAGQVTKPGILSPSTKTPALPVVSNPWAGTSTQTSLSASVAVDFGGDTGTCTAQGQATNCNGTATVSGLAPGTQYTVTFCATSNFGLQTCNNTWVGATQSPPPPPTVTLTGVSRTGCTITPCYSMHVVISNFAPGTSYGVTCNPVPFGYTPPNIVTDGAGNGNTNAPAECYVGKGITVSVTVGGVTSNSLRY